MHSIIAQITEAEIKRNAIKRIKQITDPQHPLKFRYSKCRKKGTWFIVINKSGKSIWRKIGGYPSLNRTAIIKKLPDIITELSINKNSNAITASNFKTVESLINWYIERSQSARFLSEERRIAIKSIANKHIIEKLGNINVKDLDHEKVDTLLITKMQNKYSLAYTRQVYDILRLAFKQAQKLRLIQINPIAAFKFTDFITAPIKPKQGRLNAQSLNMIFGHIKNANQEQKMLILLMLLHGTRIGETRQIKWSWFDWQENYLLIPAKVTKTKEALSIPLTPQAINIIKKFKDSKNKSSVYMFPTGKGSSIGKTKADACIKKVAEGMWTAHDLRKLARTCWLDLGADYFIGELLLNHKMKKLDATYIHTHAEKLKRAALTKYHDWLFENGLDKLI